MSPKKLRKFVVYQQKIRALANEIAKVAFEEEFELPIEWTDFRGESTNP